MTALFADQATVTSLTPATGTLPSETNRRMHEVLATLGHELRNPLSALTNALELWPSAMHDPKLMEELRSIMWRQVHQMTSLSDNLVDAARITRGNFELHLKQVDLKHLIDDACEEVRPFVDHCGHQLDVTMPHEPLPLYGDASRLLQVFANLIQNAAKFTEQPGGLSVTVERRVNTAIVSIRDNGAGIEPHMLSAIFEPFTQVNEAGFTSNNGLGIGLQLVKTIVERHGGSVAAHSEGLGHGSEFTVRLPLQPDAGPSRSPAAQRPIASQTGNRRGPLPYRILVVDDARFSAELLSRLLRPMVQDVLVADNGATAIQMVLNERPDVVFLDIVMRGLDGYDVARELRTHQELSGLVLIALSGNGDEASKRRALDAGFDKYLVKPTSVALLTETLASIPATIRTRER